MPEYLSPAVYVEEVSSGVKPLEAVGTSTAGFVGHTVKGPIGVATPLNNFAEFVKRFGAFSSDALLPFGVKAFFDEGGTSCYVVRTVHYNNAGQPQAVTATRTYVTVGNAAENAIRIDATSAGAWGNDLGVRVEQPTATTFRITVFQSGLPVEIYDALTMDQAGADYVEGRINGRSDLIAVTDLAKASLLPLAGRRPVATVGTLPEALQTGADGLTSIADDDYVGSAIFGNGLNAFNKIDEVNILAIPEGVKRSVHVRGMAYCDNRQDCFYVADSQQTIATADDLLDYKNADGVFSGGNAISSKYGALYAPWIRVFDPRSGGTIAIPPSAAVAGRYAGVDGTRGVHKAPAGVLDGQIGTALGLTFAFVAADQDKLNPKGINVIRAFPGTGNVIWGARTVSSDAEWRYINVRRLFIMIRQSVLLGTTWVVFEPNDPSLWKSIERNIAAFLRLQWLAGALVGETADQAFFVKCDAETNPIESIKLGRVITEIGVAPSKPAEFVIFRISQQDGGASATA